MSDLTMIKLYRDFCPETTEESVKAVIEFVAKYEGIKATDGIQFSTFKRVLYLLSGTWIGVRNVFRLRHPEEID